MFGFRRGGFPFFIPLLIAVAFGYLLAGGVGSAVGALLVLPLLALKLLFMVMMFGMLFRFAAGGPWGRRWDDGGSRHGPPWADHRPRPASRPTSGDEVEDDVAGDHDRDWEEALRAAKREIDKLFPDPKE